MAAMGTAGFRLGGSRTMMAAMILAGVSVMQLVRFRVGALDHHNVQMVLVATMASGPARCIAPLAVLRARRPAAAGALAVGAETTPIIAVVAMIVAVLWALDGQGNEAPGACLLRRARPRHPAFYSSPPARPLCGDHCDNLSFGYLTLTVAGAASLFLAAILASQQGAIIRFASLA